MVLFWVQELYRFPYRSAGKTGIAYAFGRFTRLQLAVLSS